MNRIHSIGLTADALRDCVVALRQRANALHSLADDCPHWDYENPDPDCACVGGSS